MMTSLMSLPHWRHCLRVPFTWCLVRLGFMVVIWSSMSSLASIDRRRYNLGGLALINRLVVDWTSLKLKIKLATSIVFEELSMITIAPLWKCFLLFSTTLCISVRPCTFDLGWVTSMIVFGCNYLRSQGQLNHNFSKNQNRDYYNLSII
jgi:hypothetical protein